jgi:hypothetical protein
MHELRLTTIN